MSSDSNSTPLSTPLVILSNPSKERRPLSTSGTVESMHAETGVAGFFGKGWQQELAVLNVVTVVIDVTANKAVQPPVEHTLLQKWSLGVNVDVTSHGVMLVEMVVPNSPCEGTIAIGNVLHTLNGKPLDSVESLHSALLGIQACVCA